FLLSFRLQCGLLDAAKSHFEIGTVEMQHEKRSTIGRRPGREGDAKILELLSYRNGRLRVWSWQRHETHGDPPSVQPTARGQHSGRPQPLIVRCLTLGRVNLER